MAVKVVKLHEKKGDKITATIVADTKLEVTSDLEIGGCSFDFGSVAVTVDGDVAIMDSEGSWNWLEEES